MSPASIHYYNDWSSLNYMYGVVNISKLSTAWCDIMFLFAIASQNMKRTYSAIQ